MGPYCVALGPAGPYCGALLWAYTMGPYCGPVPPCDGPTVGPYCGPLLWARWRTPRRALLRAHTVEPYCVAVDLAERTVAPYSGPSLWALRGPTVGPLPAT